MGVRADGCLITNSKEVPRNDLSETDSTMKRDKRQICDEQTEENNHERLSKEKRYK
jgi:hypothetical protein